MAHFKPVNRQKYIPGSDSNSDEIFDFPFITDDETLDFINRHGRIMFIVRGPPGTGKSTLSSLIGDQYANGIVCCADHYFTESFNPKTRNKDTLAKSHEFCHKKVKESCMKGYHPIIVQNTHMRKREMQEYINYAAEYGYTIIMAITLRKFIVTPEILEKSNTKGLTKDYFEKRLKQWEEVYPMYTGWFLCPKDTSYLFSQMKVSLEALLGDGKFCRVFDIYDKDVLLSHYKVKRMVFCKAADLRSMEQRMSKQYYLSEKVCNCYGKAFSIQVIGYIVSEQEIAAVVRGRDYMKDVVINQEKPLKDDACEMFTILSLDNNTQVHSKLVELDQEFSDTGESVELCDWDENEEVNAKDFRLILLAHSHPISIADMRQNEENCESLLLDKIDSNGCLENTNFIELDDVSILRLTDSAWFVKAPKKITMQSVFTGLYI